MPLPYTSSAVETERLVLRPFEARDLDALFASYSRPDVVRLLYEEPRSLEQTRLLLERRMRFRTITGEGDTASFAIALQSDGSVVGDCMVHLVSATHRQAEIGFVLHPDHHGRGYATESAGEMVRIAFEELEAHRVVGRLEARNTPSARVLERLGMRREAHLVENEWVKGEWQSELVYAILDREWRTPKADAASPAAEG